MLQSPRRQHGLRLRVRGAHVLELDVTSLAGSRHSETELTLAVVQNAMWRPQALVLAQHGEALILGASSLASRWRRRSMNSAFCHKSRLHSVSQMVSPCLSLSLSWQLP